MVHPLCIELVGTGIDDLMANAILGIAGGGVPIGKHGAGGWHAARAQRIEILAGQHAIANRRPVDLAGIEVADERPSQFVFIARPGNQERRLRPVSRLETESLRDMARKFVRHDFADQRIVPVEHAFLIDLRAPRAGS